MWTNVWRVLLQSNELGFLVSLAGQGECFSAHKFQDFYQDRIIQFARS
jgi:hypothetical protein